MRLLIAVLLTLALCTTTAAEHNQLTAEQIRDGWISLFDGETLFGWTPQGEVDWQVVDGEIRATEGEAGLLLTTSEFADYNLHAEFRAEPTTNSGLFLRTSTKPADVTKDCYEVNIAPTENPFPTGSVVGRHRTDDEQGEAAEALGRRVAQLRHRRSRRFYAALSRWRGRRRVHRPQSQTPRTDRPATQPRQDRLPQCSPVAAIDRVDL